MHRLLLLAAAALLLAPSVRAGEPAAANEADRKKAGELLALYFPSASPTPDEVVEIRKLIALLGAPDFEKRDAASKKLAAFGEKARAELVRAKSDKDPEVSSRAELALEAIAEGYSGQRVNARMGLRKIRKTALAVIDERIKARQGAAGRDKKEAAELKEKGREDAAVAMLARAKESVDRALALAELRKEIATDNPFDEIRQLVKKGNRNEAMKKLQACVRDMVQKGKWTPDRQKEYQQLVVQVHQMGR
ncbi:MAG: hypothetical protein ACYTGB_01145 [Planctomycetota bacterium]|jgi:hypothetical protein